MAYAKWYRDTVVGDIYLKSNGEALTGVYFADKQRFWAPSEDDIMEEGLPIFDQAFRWLDIYFQGKDPGFTPPCNLDHISPFRQLVCKEMLKIPFGETVTYGEIARSVGRITGKTKMSAQAVGGAVGHNPIGIIIPCHRVMGANKNLTGYGGGLDRKIALLELEGIQVGQLYRPTKGTAL